MRQPPKHASRAPNRPVARRNQIARYATAGIEVVAAAVVHALRVPGQGITDFVGDRIQD
jgi:hypothetical protein